MNRIIVTVFVIASMSGCISTGNDAGASAPPIVITDPSDFNGSLAPGSHIHDYWRGDTVATVFEETVSLTYLAASTCPNSFLPVNTNCIEVEPVDRGIVPPGTQALEVSATWTSIEPTPLGQLDVHYEVPSNAAGFQDGTLRVATGESAIINVTSDTQDLPHTSTTRWRFWVAMATGFPAATYSVDFKVVAQRQEGNISVAPPHPDHWGNESVLLLASYDGPFGELLGQNEAPGTSDHPGYEFSPEGDAIVAPPAKQVRVQAYLNLTTPPDLAPDPVLNWHGADRRTAEETARPPTDSMVNGGDFMWAWVIELEGGHYDSPYATESNWAIFIDWHGGIGPASATYSEGDAVIRVTVEK